MLHSSEQRFDHASQARAAGIEWDGIGHDRRRQAEVRLSHCRLHTGTRDFLSHVLDTLGTPSSVVRRCKEKYDKYADVIDGKSSLTKENLKRALQDVFGPGISDGLVVRHQVATHFQSPACHHHLMRIRQACTRPYTVSKMGVARLAGLHLVRQPR